MISLHHILHKWAVFCDIMCTCVYDYSTTHANQPFALVASRNNAIVNDAKNRYSSPNFILVHSN